MDKAEHLNLGIADHYTLAAGEDVNCHGKGIVYKEFAKGELEFTNEPTVAYMGGEHGIRYYTLDVRVYVDRAGHRWCTRYSADKFEEL